jgi:adenylate kinase family enzyme
MSRNDLDTHHPALSAPGQRIVVIGVTGSGKTTLAQQLARRLGYPHVELDALHWDADWTMAPTDVFRERIAQALSGPVWVTDGNYSSARDLIWGRADTIIWLDYALPLILWRLTRRNISHVVRRTELWNGNRETFYSQFISKENLYLYALQTYRRRRRDYPRLFAEPIYAHLTTIHLRSPRAAARWLAGLQTG